MWINYSALLSEALLHWMNTQSFIHCELTHQALMLLNVWRIALYKRVNMALGIRSTQCLFALPPACYYRLNIRLSIRDADPQSIA